jgi:hypothetical protein
VQIVPLAASAYEIVMSVHVMAVVIAFGWTFVLPVMYAVATRSEARTIPVLHRIEVLASRVVLNPALLVVVGAGVFLASDGHHWSEFFVQWGLGVAIVIGGLVGSVMIPASRRAEALARRDLEAGGDEFTPSAEYRSVVRRLNVVGGALWLLVLVTILFMVVKP